MTNGGKNMLSEMEFEQRLNEMGDDQISLLKFLARQQYQMSQLCPIHSRQIKAIQNRDKKFFGAIGGISGVIGATIAGVVNYLMRR